MNTKKFERNYWARVLEVGDYGGRRPRVGDIQPRDGFPVPEPTYLPMPPLSDPCLFWRYGLNGDGYGVYRGQRVHRLVWAQVHSSLERSEDVLHLCHRRACFQPAHLYVGSAVENARDRKARHGGLDLNYHRSLPPGRDGVEALWRDVREEGGRVMEYGLERTAAIIRGMDFAWDPDIPEGLQLELDPTEPVDCPRHNFRVPVGSFRQCTICGLLSFAYRDAVAVTQDRDAVLGLYPCWYPPGGFIAQVLSLTGGTVSPPRQLRIMMVPPTQGELLAAMRQFAPGDTLRPIVISSERTIMPLPQGRRDERQMAIVGNWSLQDPVRSVPLRSR